MPYNDNDTAMTKANAIKARIKDAMRKWRSAKRLTQAEAASMLGVTRRTYEKYEKDPVRGIPMHVVAQLCLVAELDADWLLLGRKRRKTAPNSLPALARSFKKIKQVA